MTGSSLEAGCFLSLFCSLMHGSGADDIRYGILRFEEKSYCCRLRLSFYSLPIALHRQAILVSAEVVIRLMLAF